MRSWLLCNDYDIEDQYVVSAGLSSNNRISIFSNKKKSASKVLDLPKGSESKVQWSTHGTYLATWHQQGIAIWGGADMTRKGRFNHNEVKV